MRNNNFDFLRFVFAFIVVIGHLIIISGQSELQIYKPFFSTYTSVTAFFCISGYLIAQSYYKSGSIWEYLKKRAARLLPGYIFVIVCSALLLSIISTYSLTEYFHQKELYKYLASNLMFLNFIEPNLPGVFTHNVGSADINGALWTLKVEVSFYLSLPVLVYFLRRVTNKNILLLIVYIASVCYKHYFEHLGTTDQTFTFLARQLPGFMSYFSCGIFIYLNRDLFLKYKNRIILPALILYITEYYLGYEIFSPVAIAILIFYFAFSFPVLNNFGKYGDISYGIYIFHCPIIKTITYLGFFRNYNVYSVSLICILLVLITGFLSWHFLEKRFLPSRTK